MDKSIQIKKKRIRNVSMNTRALRKLILIYQVLALISVLFLDPEVPAQSRLIFSAGLIVISYLACLFAPRITRGDHYLILIAIMLFSIGATMIYRLDAGLGVKQVIWLVVGVVAYFMTYFILKKVKGWPNFGRFYFLLITGLFVATLAFGSIVGGAKNWIVIGGERGFMFQPSEFIKIVLVFLLAHYYTSKEKYQDLKIGSFVLGEFLPMIVIYFFIAMLFLQAELGTAIIFYVLFIAMQFIHETPKKYIIINLLLAIVGALCAYFLFAHIRVRVQTWIDPWSTIDNTGYQITQSLFAIGSGGFFGRGIGMGSPQMIPLAFTDFIFSAICEEMGLFAGMGVIMLFLILVYRGFKISLSQTNEFYSLVALGLSIIFGIQAFIIIGGVVKLIPLTGITIPFVTYGGSSILSSFIALGVLQYCSTKMKG